MGQIINGSFLDTPSSDKDYSLGRVPTYETDLVPHGQYSSSNFSSKKCIMLAISHLDVFHSIALESPFTPMFSQYER